VVGLRKRALLLVPVKSFEVSVQRTLSNLIDEIGNTGRGGKLSIISFVETKLNPKQGGIASQTERWPGLEFIRWRAD
jgi:hypothetical protein